jgi:hypothetical protein
MEFLGFLGMLSTLVIVTYVVYIMSTPHKQQYNKKGN